MAEHGDPADEPIVSCTLQAGTLSVFEDRVRIEREARSMFEDKDVPMAEVTGVAYSRGVIRGSIQVEQAGADLDAGSLLSHPVDENTLYVPLRKRECVQRARDEILARAGEE